MDRAKIKDVAITGVFTVAVLLAVGPLVWVMWQVASVTHPAMVVATIGIGLTVVMTLAVVWTSVFKR